MALLALAISGLALVTQSTDGAAVVERARQRLIATHPAVAVNDEALRLEALAAKLGVDLSPPLPGRAHPLLAERDLVQRLRFGGYVSDRAESANDAIPAPAAAMEGFLVDHAETLEGIRALLVSQTLPRWAMDLAKSKAAEPDPNTEGTLILHRLLLTNALIAARDGRSADAETWLEASWRLKESTADRPSLTWQLITIAVSRWEAGVLRKLPSSDAGWTERMRFRPQRDRTLRAMNDDMVIGVTDISPEELSRWSPADLIDGIGRAVEWLGKMNPCRFAHAEAEEWWKPFFPGPIEKTLAGIAMPSLGSAAHRLYRLQIEGELTTRVLEARRALMSADAPAPGTSSDAESEVCPGARWSTLAQPGGGAHVRFDGKIEEWPDAGIRPPLEFTIRATASPTVTPTPAPPHP
ncbi:MAG TPA: hypothetical protein VH854_03970 [Thermoanaerobaculia bacterium]|nr:hypothetical protein [Thermoanaerobaculia bacterium]